MMQQLPIVARESRNIIDKITHVRSIYAGFSSSSSDLHLLRRYVSGARSLSHSFSSVLDTIGGASGYPEWLTASCNKRQAREYVHRNTKADTAVRATPIAYQATQYTHTYKSREEYNTVYCYKVRSLSAYARWR